MISKLANSLSIQEKYNTTLSDFMEPTIIDAYVRLSRDDNKRNYSSIENQKKIICQYAEENNMIVRHIYEDDGISGYSFVEVR